MANIRVDLDYTIQDGTSIVFRSPCDCTEVTGLIVYYNAGEGNPISKEFALADAHGENVGDIPHLFGSDVAVKVILDVTSGMAFVQNADTNAYLEGRFAEMLPREELNTAINEALEQAKASGEFKGDKGDPGSGGAADSSSGHLYRIEHVQDQTITTYKETNGVIAEHSTVKGSDYIKCPGYLGMVFQDSTARAYVYFYSYDSVDGEYVPRWDIIDTTSSTNVKNYLSATNAVPYMFKIPDGVYMRIGKAVGNVDFFGWDGVPFGMPLSADYNYPKVNGEVDIFHPDGSYGVTIPGDAEYILAHEGCEIWAVNGYKGTTATNVHSSVAKSFVKLPAGYDFFRARIVTAEDGKAVAKSVAGDMSGLLSVMVSTEAEEPSAKALRILENCKAVCNIKWTPKENVPVNEVITTADDGTETSKIVAYFQKNVEYMGIPYGSDWKNAHFIGWHVTPHTFVNAVNDEDSIFYKEKVSSVSGKTETLAPYYSLVCSSFATLCAGWPYPANNKACLYDPNVEIHHAQTPPIGGLYSSMDHVVIAERIDHMKNDVAISAYECMRPVSQRSTRYGKVVKSSAIDVYHPSYGSDYFNDYKYVYDNYLANPDMSVNIPYIDTSDVEIIGGSARPYKGDKSVYTSAEAVLINIKDTSATTLYLVKDGEAAQSIAINGAKQIDVKSYLSGGGIYFVYTEKNATQESFEYHEVETIEYAMVNGVPVLESKDFWYIMFMMSGDPRANGKKSAMAQLPADDYSYLIQNGAKCEYVYSIFRKGEYGAYAVPFVLTETVVDDAPPTSEGAVSDEQIAAAVEAYFAENPVEGGGGETWEPILAYTGVNGATLVNLGGFENISDGNGASGLVTIASSGTSKIIFPLGAKYRRLFFRVRTNATAACSAGNIQLHWGGGDSNWTHFTAQKGTDTWTDIIWEIECAKNHITANYGTSSTQYITRNYSQHDFSSINQLVLTTVTTDATFNDVAVEIWGVSA